MAPPSLPKASQSLQKPPKVSPKTPQSLPKVSPKLPRLPPEVSPGYGRVPRGSQSQNEGKKRKKCQKVHGGDSIFSCLGRAKTVLKKQTVLRNGLLPPRSAILNGSRCAPFAIRPKGPIGSFLVEDAKRTQKNTKKSVLLKRRFRTLFNSFLICLLAKMGEPPPPTY